tara:strand:- start:8836 stop:9942 length:1107 start_codon:yes stop_codon:yes gene_type:complete
MIKELSLLTNFKAGDMTAVIGLHRPIHADPKKGINGEAFTNEMNFLAENGVKEVTIEINSGGGSIKEGFSIFHAILSSPMKTITKVVGIAASMAGMIAQAGDKRVIMDYALYHSHGPQAPKGQTADAGMVELMRGSLKTILMSKADISEEKATEMLNGETMMNAVNASKLGFFDEVIETRGLKPVVNMENSVSDLTEYYNGFINQNNRKMKKVTSFLELDNEASEDAILKAVQGFKNEADKVEELTNTISVKDAEIGKLKESLNAGKVSAATELVENSIKLGKITEESKTVWIEQATNNFEGTKTMLSSIGGVVEAEDITNKITPVIIEGRKDWSFDKWQNEDSKGLGEMKVNDVEKFNALLEKHLED